MTSHEPRAVGSVPDFVEAVRLENPTGEVLLLVDQAVTRGEVAGEIRSALADRLAGEVAVGGDTDVDVVVTTAEAVPPGGVVVGVGGGAVMDRAKLVALLAGQHGVEKRLTVPQRCGFLMLPPAVRRSVGLALVPTTVGTGSEASRTACVRTGRIKKIVYGDALRCDVAAIVPAATRTLPHDLVMEGALEALIRVSSYYVGHDQPRHREDTLAEDLAADLVATATTYLRGPASEAAQEARRRLAWLSNRTHQDTMLAGLVPFADKSWPLANELSTRGGIRKLTALALVVPSLWRRIAVDGGAWGSPARLQRWWEVVGHHAPEPLPTVPADGLEALMDLWGIRRPTVPLDPTVVASATAEAWGRGLPMLRGLTEADLCWIYEDALRGRAHGFPVHSEGGEMSAALQRG